eukprot:319073_1
MDNKQIISGTNSTQNIIIIILSVVLSVLILGIIGYIVYRKFVNKKLNTETVSKMNVASINGEGNELKKIENGYEGQCNIVNIGRNDNDSEEELYQTQIEQDYITPKSDDDMNGSNQDEELYVNKTDVNITEGNNEINIDNEKNQETKGYMKEDESESSDNNALNQTTSGDNDALPQTTTGYHE